MMKKVILTLTLTLSACAPPPITSHPTEEMLASREATFGEVENSVEVRPSAGDDAENAEVGTTLFVGGSAESGEDGRARLDLLPEKTTIRLAPNSSFTLDSLNNDTTNPATQLNLLFGQIWIILNGGELEVETSYGTASVRGSMMGVGFTPEGGMLVSCFEGHCALENEAGRTELEEGFASAISTLGEAPSSPKPICGVEIKKWTDADPAIKPQLPKYPTPLPLPTPTPKPFLYSFTNNCEDLTWTWSFFTENGEPHIFNIAPGESISGELPPGEYTITESLEGRGSVGKPQVLNQNIDSVLSCEQ